MNILGISAFYHDSAACLIKDGEIIAAAQEERFTRKKHDAAFPSHAVKYCLKEIHNESIDLVIFYDKPLVKFERIIKTYLTKAPFGLRSFLKAMPLWLKEKLWIKEMIAKELNFKGNILFAQHHQSHAASAFYPSPFNEAAILTLDGVGEWATSSYGIGKGNKIEILKEINFPHSLGLLYSAFTYYLGFRVNSGEYKVMGLAPYGEPAYVNTIRDNLIEIKEDGSFKLNLSFFDFESGLKMTNNKFNKLFGGPARTPEAILTQKEMDIAKSIQIVTEEIVLKMGKHIREITRQRNLCLAGGVALNCVANGLLLKENIFDHIWIQPAAGDAGGALGASLLAWHGYLGNSRIINNKEKDTQKGSLLGPEYTDDEIEIFLKEIGADYDKFNNKTLLEKCAELLSQEKIIGWFQNRMEFGPRALGARSIIGDARSEKMQSKMNLKIKYRESFRPFAPTVLKERANDYFELEHDSLYMLFTAKVKNSHKKQLNEQENQLLGLSKLNIARSDISAVTHVDYSARIQTIDEKTNPIYYNLVKEFEKITGCAVIVNTSFNVRGEPIVQSPQDAYRCFMNTGMDYLAIGNFLLDKKSQPAFNKNGNSQKNSKSILIMIKDLIGFVKTISIILVIIAAKNTWDGRFLQSGILFFAAAVFIIIGLINTDWIKPIYKSWMNFSEKLAIIMNTLLLGIIFYIVFSPIGIILRLFRMDILDRKLEKNKNSYWLKKDVDEFKAAQMERMY